MEELFPYYERELEFIRQMGAEFAAAYPKEAGRLQLSKDRPADPHVERLIEAFALLAGRVQHKIDDEFPEVTESLLDLLYPHYLRPVPSMAIAQFEPDMAQSKPEAAQLAPHVLLHSRPAGGSVCTFRTTYPVELWPLRIAAASVTTPGNLAPGLPGSVANVIRLELQTAPNLAFSKLPLRNLRFYLNGVPAVTHPLYEVLLNDVTHIVIRDPQATTSPLILAPGQLQPVGLSTAEGVLPYSDRSFLGYRLLQEYFHFPEKFLFVDLNGLGSAGAHGFGQKVEILLCLRALDPAGRLAKLEQAVGPDTFQLGCTPAVNLFERPAETIRLSQTRTEYRIVADQHRQSTTEIYSVDQVSSTATYLQTPKVFQPFYSFHHSESASDGRQFWFARRRPSGKPRDPGTEVYLSLVDLDGHPSLPPVEMLTVQVTCTNRDFPESLQWSGQWGEVSAEGQQLVRARLLRKPTAAARPPLRRGLQWRLISHLGLNHLSVTREGAESFREILRLYDFSTGDESAAIQKQIAAVSTLSTRPIVSRVQSDTGVTFCRGTEVAVEFDEQQSGASSFLFASVLERFFGLYAAINSFSRLTVRTKQRRGVLKQWPPLAGEQRIQ